VSLLRHLLAAAALSAMLLSGCASPHGQPRKGSEVLAPNEILDFATLYAENCAGCHGAAGKGGAAIALADPVYLAIADDTAVRKVIAQQVTVRYEGLRVKANGDTSIVNLVVRPVTKPDSVQGLIMVLFEDVTPETRPEAQIVQEPITDTDQRIADLERELRTKGEYLQTTIEELDATNEELKSANEEIESSNEELQSTNEELETAKEELQSANEELTTLNEEVSNRNIEMAQINNDLTNLLSSINIPIVMVDSALAVRRITPMAERLFNLIPTDIGRRLSDLKTNLTITNLDQMIREVIDTFDLVEQVLERDVSAVLTGKREDEA